VEAANFRIEGGGRSTAPAPVIAEARLPASCGELLQGLLDGRRVLLSCPIDRHVRVRVALSPAGSGRIAGLAGAPKAERALRALLADYTDVRLDARAWILDPLPRGKGLASSTADVGGVIAAGLKALGQPVHPATVARRAARIEPSDSTPLPGLSLFDYHRGEEIMPLGPPPPMRILMLDWGGRVDSVRFNRWANRQALERNSARFREAVDWVCSGIDEADLLAIGRGASLSAELHQGLLPRPWLAPSLDLCRRLGGYGVNIAHSGTLTGILLPDEPDRMDHAIERARRELSGLRAVSACRLIAGGVQLAERAREVSPSVA